MTTPKLPAIKSFLKTLSDFEESTTPEYKVVAGIVKHMIHIGCDSPEEIVSAMQETMDAANAIMRAAEQMINNADQ